MCVFLPECSAYHQQWKLHSTDYAVLIDLAQECFQHIMHAEPQGSGVSLWPASLALSIMHAERYACGLLVWHQGPWWRLFLGCMFITTASDKKWTAVGCGQQTH
jgi:hypothetical protein